MRTSSVSRGSRRRVAREKGLEPNCYGSWRRLGTGRSFLVFRPKPTPRDIPSLEGFPAVRGRPGPPGPEKSTISGRSKNHRLKTQLQVLVLWFRFRVWLDSGSHVEMVPCPFAEMATGWGAIGVGGKSTENRAEHLQPDRLQAPRSSTSHNIRACPQSGWGGLAKGGLVI